MVKKKSYTSSLRLDTRRTDPVADWDIRRAAGPKAEAVDPGKVKPAVKEFQFEFLNQSQYISSRLTW